MESHPSYPVLLPLIQKYPRCGGALFQTYNDLLLTQQWTDLEVLDLGGCSRGAFRGRRPRADSAICVLPCSLTESLSMSLINAAFSELGDPPELYMAITSEDSSVVYYKFSTGIVKPQL